MKSMLPGHGWDCFEGKFVLIREKLIDAIIPVPSTELPSTIASAPALKIDLAVLAFL